MKKIYFILIILIYIIWGCLEHTDDHNKNEHSQNQELNHDPDHEDEIVGHDDKDESEHEEDHYDELYGIVEVKAQPFFEIIRTSGQILPAQGDEITITAMHDGVVVFNEKQLLAGKKVNKGDRLLTISGKELIHDNIEASYFDIKAAYGNAKSNYERSVELNKDKIISDKELLDVKLEFEKAKNKYEVVRKNYSTGGQRLTASISGFVKDIMVAEGQFVVTGQPLLKLTKNKRLVIKADVPQRYFHMLKNISSANFITVYDKKHYDIKDLKGQLISYGKTTEANSLFTPVFFEVDNKGSLFAGSYIEVFLKTVELPKCIIIPKTAILEESGKYYVFVEDNDEFEKRFITIDCNDGLSYHIAEGLIIGERVVTQNPYQVKLSKLSGSLPENSHNH